jgi:succinate-semialdehyde dehydrogenase/glutarate-semialdehyde dehydrogenase
LPKGVVKLVIGSSKEIAGPPIESKVVRKISYTGSTEVGIF